MPDGGRSMASRCFRQGSCHPMGRFSEPGRRRIGRLGVRSARPGVSRGQSAVSCELSLLQKSPTCHPERSGPKGRAVEGSPPGKERAPRKAKRHLTCGDPSTHSSNSLAQGDMKRRFLFRFRIPNYASTSAVSCDEKLSHQVAFRYWWFGRRRFRDRDRIRAR